MSTYMRRPTLLDLNLGTPLGIFFDGQLPVSADDLVYQIFGPPQSRGAFVISGINGTVGSGKADQLGHKLLPFGIPIVGIDLPGAPDGLAKSYPGLVRAFGKQRADDIRSNIIRMSYDGKNLPSALAKFNPRVLLEAIPEILKLKTDHHALFQTIFPELISRSTTSGFPMHKLGVGIAHTSFPHPINPYYECIEEEVSLFTKLLWAVGLKPIPMDDFWSFVLDVLFCGLTQAAIRYHEASNMPFPAIDKYIRKLLGPNPFRAHDVIGAEVANFLTHSCLYHLDKHYGGGLFTPADTLAYRKESGQNWYLDRPIVRQGLAPSEEDGFRTWILGPLFQMTSLMLKEERVNLSCMNDIGEGCAQFRNGNLAIIRNLGHEKVIKTVKDYHKLHPGAAKSCWYPEVFEQIDTVEFQQLYVNAEHDGNVGVITIGRKSYNWDVDAELNRAINWLKAQGIRRVIITGDFHLATELIGADTSEFFHIRYVQDAYKISRDWSGTARRLHNEFEVSVGFINGKRCWGGMLELMMHCHYLISVDNADLCMPEITIPVIPGMDGCHWPFRKAHLDDWPRILHFLLSGESVKAKDAVRWLADYAGPMDEALKIAWKIVTGGKHGLTMREVKKEGLEASIEVAGLESGSEATEAAKKAIAISVLENCNLPLHMACEGQSRSCANFMITEHFKEGRIGQEADKILNV